MNDVVDSAGRGRGWQRLPRTLVRSFVVPTHAPRSVMDTSVTAHCHAAPAQLTRAYQSDHRRNVLTPTTTRAVHLHPPSITPLTTPFHIRSAQRGTSGAATGGGGRSAPDPDYASANPYRLFVKRLAEACLNSGKKVLADGVGFFQERIAIDLENAHADLGVLLEQVGDRVVRADPGGTVGQVRHARPDIGPRPGVQVGPCPRADVLDRCRLCRRGSDPDSQGR